MADERRHIGVMEFGNEVEPEKASGTVQPPRRGKDIGKRPTTSNRFLTPFPFSPSALSPRFQVMIPMKPCVNLLGSLGAFVVVF